MLLLLYDLSFFDLNFPYGFWISRDFTSRQQSRKREINMFQYNLHALVLSPLFDLCVVQLRWFVVGSHSPVFELSQSQNPMFTLFSKKETDLVSSWERPQDLMSTMASWKMSKLPETFWHLPFMGPNNLFKQSVSRLFFRDILRPSMSVLICDFTVYFIYLSATDPDLRWGERAVIQTLR